MACLHASGSASQVILYSKATVLNLLRVSSDVSSKSWVVIGGIQVTHSDVLYGYRVTAIPTLLHYFVLYDFMLYDI